MIFIGPRVRARKEEFALNYHCKPLKILSEASTL